MFTICNATLVAVMQVGIIVAGVLASGFWHKASISNGLTMPLPAGLLYSYGIVGFAIPLSWLTLAMLVRRNPAISDEVKGLAFGFGVLYVRA